jgi:hydrogenase-4 component B
MIFNYYNLKQLVLLSLTAALLHILNHAIFKSLLFTNAGSVLYGTGTRNMNELGGLSRKMEITAICGLIGTAAISALPPLNGFASELLIFRSFIEAGTAVKSPEMVFVIVLCGIIIAVTSGVVMWVMVKSFGTTFLGAPRTEKAVKTHKIPWSMNAGMVVLSFYAVIFGIFSPATAAKLSKLSGYIMNMNESSAKNMLSYEITAAAGIFILIIVIILIINSLTSKTEVVEYNDTWGCGFNNPKPYMQYSPNGFAQPASRLLGCLTGYEKEVRIKDTIFLRQRFTDIIERYLYSKVKLVFDYLASKVVKIHYGKIQAYISYIFISLIAAIILVIKFV